MTTAWLRLVRQKRDVSFSPDTFFVSGATINVTVTTFFVTALNPCLTLQKGVKLTFVRQPELSTTGSHGKLLLAIYSYFAEAEREFISMRVKQGLADARAKGVKLGRPKGSRNKKRVLDPYRDEIFKYLQKGIDLANVRKLINPELERPISYNSYKYFVEHDPDLVAAWRN